MYVEMVNASFHKRPCLKSTSGFARVWKQTNSERVDDRWGMYPLTDHDSRPQGRNRFCETLA